METNAENLEKQLDLLENKGERTEKHDSLYAFLKSPEQVLNSCWKNWWKHGKAQFITAFWIFCKAVSAMLENIFPKRVSRFSV